MALSSPDSNSQGQGSAVVSGSVKSPWRIAHDDAKQTGVAVTSPFNLSQTGLRWISVPTWARAVFLRARSTAGGTKTTDPVVAVVGYFGEAIAGTSPSQAEIQASGGEVLHTALTCTLAKVFDDADGTDSAAWDTGATLTNRGQGYDVQAASWIAVPVTTAAAGPNDVDIEVKFIN